MVMRWEAGDPAAAEHAQENPIAQAKLRLLLTGVKQILLENDPSHTKLFEEVFSKIKTGKSGNGTLEMVPRYPIPTIDSDVPYIEFGFRPQLSTLHISPQTVTLNQLDPVLYIRDLNPFDIDDLSAPPLTSEVADGNWAASFEAQMAPRTSKEVVDDLLQDVVAEERLRKMISQPEVARDFILGHFQGKELAQLLLPFAMAVTYYKTVVDEGKYTEEFLPVPNDMRRIPPEALFNQEREPLFFDPLERVYTYWGQLLGKGLGLTSQDIKAAIPHDVQNIAGVGLADFLSAVRKGAVQADNQTYYAVKKFFDSNEQVTDENRKNYTSMLRILYKKFIVLRALFYRQFADKQNPPVTGEQLLNVWIKNTR